MRGACEDSNCTFNVTKVCVRGLAADECPNRPLLDAQELGDDDEEARRPEPVVVPPPAPVRAPIGAPVLERPREMPRLPESRTLDIGQANALMEARQTFMIGIVGLPAAGKTACLVSAYLLLAKGEFEGFSFADSDTLRAFEEISTGSRTWSKGSPPEHLTQHTTLSNDREAGFLHLRLRRQADGRLFDLLMPDLPGEWSKELIDKRDSTRLEFLRSASVIWFMIDGRQFASDKTVVYARYRAGILLERLAELLGVHRPRILVVPTWQDSGALPAAEASNLIGCGKSCGFEIEIAPIASFSWNDAVQPGHGVASLVQRSIACSSEAPDFWPASDASADDRALAAFRGRG